MKKKFLVVRMLLAGLLRGVSAFAQSFFDGLMGWVAESAGQPSQDQMDQCIDEAIDTTDDSVVCIATDRECLKRAREQGRHPSADSDCLAKAQKLGGKGDIIG